MVCKKILIGVFLLLPLIIKSGSACRICDPVCCWRSPGECLNPPGDYCVGVRTAFCPTLGGCFIAFSDTHTCYGGLFKSSCYESTSVTDWHYLGEFGFSDGYSCTVKWGAICAGTYEGKWDLSEGKCVGCSGKREDIIYYCSGNSGSTTAGDSECESACGASSQCDEGNPTRTLPDICYSSYLEMSRACVDCVYYSTKYYCNSGSCGDYKVCGGSGYYCVYDNGWYWRTSRPTDFCCANINCPESKPYCIVYRCKACESDSWCGSDKCCLNTIGAGGACVNAGTIRNVGSTSYLCTS